MRRVVPGDERGIWSNVKDSSMNNVDNFRWSAAGTSSTNTYWDTTTKWSNSQWEPIKYTGNETAAGTVNLKYINQQLLRVIEPVLKALDKTRLKPIKEEVLEIVSIIVTLMESLKESGLDISNIPPLFATNIKDEFLIEWLFLNYRIGLVVESNPKDSLWYLVSANKSADFNSSGNLASANKEQLLRALTYYVIAHS